MSKDELFSERAYLTYKHATTFSGAFDEDDPLREGSTT